MDGRWLLEVAVSVSVAVAVGTAVSISIELVVLVLLERRQGTLLGGVCRLVQRGVLNRRIGGQEAATTRLAGRAQLVHPLG